MNQGLTESEKYLAGLCRHSFLSLWSYPNVFDDRGLGHEICDLLVVFGSNILIFSDKSCVFKETENIRVDWNRWYRKAVQRSRQQLYGAERYIRRCPERIFLDAQARTRLPIILSDTSSLRFFRIAVAVGAKASCQRFFNGGLGTLRLCSQYSTEITSNDSVKIELKAFTADYSDKDRDFVHIFDEAMLDLVMQELDTITDFCNYLIKKEAFFQKYDVFAEGEEDVLAYYLRNLNEHHEHDFPVKDFDKDKYTGLYIKKH